MIYCAKPVRFRERHTLVFRYRDIWCVRESADNGRQTRKIEAAMESRQERNIEPVKQGQMKPIDVAVNHIELGRMLRHEFEQQGLRRHRIGAGPSQPKSAWPGWDQLCPGVRIAASK